MQVAGLGRLRVEGFVWTVAIHAGGVPVQVAGLGRLPLEGFVWAVAIHAGGSRCRWQDSDGCPEGGQREER